MESFVDLTYRGLSLGRRVKLTQVRPSSGYLELPAPMPVGTRIAVATDDGGTFDATVTAIHEQVGGSELAPGMIITPTLSGELAAWWTARITLTDDEPAPRAKSVTVRPRSSTIVDPPSGAVVAAAPSPSTTQPLPTIAEPKADPVLAAIAGAATTIDNAQRGITNDGKTVAMTAVNPDLYTTSDEIPVARISDIMAAAAVQEQAARPTAEMAAVKAADYEVVDDGKRTTMMDAIDVTALGLDLPGQSGQMAAVKEDDGDDDPPPTASQPAMPATVKKRKKRR